MKEGFKLTLRQKIFGDLVPRLMLVLGKADLAIKERSAKRCLVRTNDTGNGKIIFILQAEVIILHVKNEL